MTANRAFIATRKGLFTVERAASGRWEVGGVSFLGDNVPMILPDRRDGTIYAALDHGHFGGKMHRSADAGKTWEEIGVPVYPPLPEGAAPETDGFGRPWPWSLKLVWALEPGAQAGTLWCGTIPGGLFRSFDRGSTWEMVRSLWEAPERRRWMGGGADLPGIHSICIDPTNPAHVKVGVSCGGVWQTRDDGQTWACRATGMRAAFMPPDQQFDPYTQDPHRVVQCLAAPEVMWAQHHNGIFRTTDAGAAWREIGPVTPSAFGFSVAVHPRDPDTAWFVPAHSDERRIPLDGKVVVTRTRDGGRSFDVLCQGLPDQHAYDLVFRHALDIDDSGEALVFGSTTGSVWVSEDAGEHWQTVATHLPPVYAVRFG